MPLFCCLHPIFVLDFHTLLGYFHTIYLSIYIYIYIDIDIDTDIDKTNTSHVEKYPHTYIYIYIYIYNISSKEVWKSNFRQYGEMKKQSAGRRVRREKIRRKKMQVREKVGKSRNTVFFRGFVAPEG